jgi:hypothetical protein
MEPDYTELHSLAQPVYEAVGDATAPISTLSIAQKTRLERSEVLEALRSLEGAGHVMHQQNGNWKISRPAPPPAPPKAAELKRVMPELRAHDINDNDYEAAKKALRAQINTTRIRLEKLEMALKVLDSV